MNPYSQKGEIEKHRGNNGIGFSTRNTYQFKRYKSDLVEPVKEGIEFPSSYRMKEFSNIASAIAYEAKLFERSLEILAHFYFSNVSKNDKQWMDMLMETLFYIKHSRTHAPLETRISVVEGLFESSNQEQNNLGFLLVPRYKYKSCTKSSDTFLSLD